MRDVGVSHVWYGDSMAQPSSARPFWFPRDALIRTQMR